MKKYIILFILLISFVGYSQQQQYHLDFEDGTPSGVASNWFTFDNNPAAAEVVDNPDLDGTNTTASKVLKVVVGPNNAFYAGVNNGWSEKAFGTWKIDMAVASNLTLSMDVHKNHVGTIGIKMGTAGQGTSFQITNQNVGNTVVDEWQTLTWDLSGINPNGELTNISQMVVFVDWTEGMPNRAEGTTVYLDNIKFNAEKLTDAPAPDLDPEDRPNLPLDFSSSNQLLPGGDGAVTSLVVDGTNDVLQIVGAAAAWDHAKASFKNNVDLSDNDNNTITFKIKPMNGTGTGNHLLKFEDGVAGPAVAELPFTTTGTEWQTITLDFPAGLGNYPTMVLFVDSGDAGANSSDTFLVDDIAGGTLVTEEVILPNLPFDFSSSNQLMPGGDGAVTSLVVDGTNDVLQIVGAAAAWDHAKASFKDNVDLSDNDNNTITFKIKPMNGTGTGNHLLKFEDGVAGPAVAELPFTTTGTEWQTITLDFPAGLGNYPTMVLFVDSGDAGAGSSDTFLVDDIAIYSATADVRDNNMLNISMYPNPTSNRLNISAQNIIKSAVIYNILGKQVMCLEINKNSESIDVSSLASGMYLIKYSLNKITGTAKFIKQ